MSDIFHRSLMPSPYRLPERALSYVQYVIINWLDIEVDETAPEWRPLLNGLTGWRNREVYYYLQYVAPDWTARMYCGQQTIALFNVKAPKLWNQPAGCLSSDWIYAGKILKGSKAADLPVFRLTRFEK